MKITGSKRLRKRTALLLCIVLFFNMLTLNTSTSKAVTQIYDEQIAQYESKIPKLSSEQAKQFLAFVYNDSKYEEIDLTDDKYYKLLTGNLEPYSGDVEQLKADINALSTFVRSNIDAQLSQSEHNTKYLSDNLIEYFKSELNGMTEIDDQIFNDYKNTWTKRLQDGLTDIMSTELAKHTGIIITQNVFDNIQLGISTYSDISSLGDKITTYVNRICAGVQGFFLPLEKEKVGRYSYFSSYLDNRKNYSSRDDMIFETIMDYNFLAAKENSYISSAIDMTTWITGKDSWSNHREELDDWAEHLYQLECFVKTIYNSADKKPTATPTTTPSASPTVQPTATPTTTPSASPTEQPTITPTLTPSAGPTVQPTATPTTTPSASPTEQPTVTPTLTPSASPTVQPTVTPTLTPSASPTVQPTASPVQTNTYSEVDKPLFIENTKVALKSVKNKKGKKIVVFWKKVIGAKGYQIIYSTNKKFKNKKTKNVDKTTATLSKLKKKKTYYIKVRAYTKVNGKKVYGKWSKSKKIKIK